MHNVTNIFTRFNRHSIALGLITALAFFIPISPALTNLFALTASLFMLSDQAARQRLLQLLKDPIVHGFILLFGIMVIWIMFNDNGFIEAKRILGKYAKWLFVPLLAAIFERPQEKSWPIFGFMLSMFITLLLSYGLWLGLFNGLQASFPDINFQQRQTNAYVFKLHITHNIFMVIAGFMALSIAWIKTYSHTSMSFIHHRWMQKIPNYAWLLFGVAALYNSMFMVAGRTSLIMVIAVGSYVVWQFIAKRQLRASLGLLALIIIGIGLVSMLDTGMKTRILQGIHEMNAWQPNKLDLSSMGIRLGLWYEAWAMIKQAPFIGHGTGSYQTLFEFTPWAEVLPPTGNPHQQFLLFWVEQGLIGLSSYIALLIVIAWRNSPTNNPASSWVRGLLIAYTAGNLFNSLHYDFSESWFFVLAIATLAFNHTTTPLYRQTSMDT